MAGANDINRRDAQPRGPGLVNQAEFAFEAAGLELQAIGAPLQLDEDPEVTVDHRPLGRLASVAAPHAYVAAGEGRFASYQRQAVAEALALQEVAHVDAILLIAVGCRGREV